MSAPREQPPGDPRLVPVLVAIGYLAALIALWGLLTLVLDRDAISETDAGPLLGPAMAASSGITTAIALWGLRRRSTLGGPIVAAVASAYLAMLVVGTIGYWVGHGALAWLVIFPARYALSPFVIGAAVLSGAAVLFLWLVTVRDRRSAASPIGHDDI
jgi:hypothetical protein